MAFETDSTAETMALTTRTKITIKTQSKRNKKSQKLKKFVVFRLVSQIVVLTVVSGDGVMSGDEECDDGGRTNGDGCSKVRAQCFLGLEHSD